MLFRSKLRFVAVYVLIVAGLGWIFLRMPTSYLPDEDQGILLTQIILPTGSTMEQTNAVAEEVRDHFLENEKDAVESCMTIAGVGFSGRAANNSMVFVKLRDGELRDRPELRAKAVAGRATGRFATKDWSYSTLTIMQPIYCFRTALAPRNPGSGEKSVPPVAGSVR